MEDLSFKVFLCARGQNRTICVYAPHSMVQAEDLEI